MKTALILLFCILALSGTAAAQTVAPSAYYDFLIGRHLDSNGDLEGALTALLRAAKLDPASAEIQADLAGLYVRLNRTTDALKAGEQALKNDPENITANRVMGSIYASIVQAAKPGTSGVRENAERAVRYLERSDPSSTASVQLLLGRMYVRSQRGQGHPPADQAPDEDLVWRALTLPFRRRGRGRGSGDQSRSHPRFGTAVVMLAEL